MDQERDADSFRITQLKDILKRLGLTTVGTRNELIRRLREHEVRGSWDLMRR